MLARLYSTLQAAAEAGRAPGFTVNNAIDVTRVRAVFSGGIAFTGYNIPGAKVKVDLRRATTRYSNGSGYADLTVFMSSNKDQDRTRLKLYTHHDGAGRWCSEGSVAGYGNLGHMSKSAEAYKDPQGAATVELVREVARLAMSACPDVAAQPELPARDFPPTAIE